MSKQLAQSWRKLAREQKRAAEMCRESGLHRASSSRAYYAAYSLVTARLVENGVTEFGRFGNPDHSSVPSLVGNTLKGLSDRSRHEVSTAVRRLCSRRISADYMPKDSVGDAESREALKDLSQAMRHLGGIV